MVLWTPWCFGMITKLNRRCKYNYILIFKVETLQSPQLGSHKGAQNADLRNCYIVNDKILYGSWREAESGDRRNASISSYYNSQNFVWALTSYQSSINILLYVDRMTDSVGFVGLQSMEMLNVRSALEEKLKQKGVFSSASPKHQSAKRNAQPLNGQLETLDDFDDNASDVRGRGKGNGHAQLSHSATLSKIATRVKKTKLISGDDDLPKRDDIGERRRNHELRVLARAGIKSNDDSDDERNTQDVDGSDDMEVDDATESESESDLEFYKQVEAQHKAKLASKSEKYSRTPAEPLLPETLVDGKRHISHQMEKNRGLMLERNLLRIQGRSIS